MRSIMILVAASMFLQPPHTVRGDWSGTVRFISNARELDDYCTKWVGPQRQGSIYVSCYIPQLNTLVLSNPCDWGRDNYALLVCHEKGHGLGWRH